MTMICDPDAVDRWQWRRITELERERDELKAHVRTLREALSGTLPLLVDYSLMLGRGATHAEQQARAALAADEGVSP